MALVLNDRVKETTTTTGTGALTLGGAVTGFETFGAGVGNSNTTYYAVTLGGSAEFEVGLGTLNSDSTTITRTTVISSSNSDSAVNFSAGTKTIFCTIPASKSVFLDASGNASVGADLSVGDDLTVEGGLIDLRSNSGSASQIKFYCEVSNAHAQTLTAQPHSAAAANTLRLPDSGDSGTQDLVAVDTTQTLTNKSLTAPTITGTAVVANLDISGDVDVDGTTNLDNTDIDGTLNVQGETTLQTHLNMGDGDIIKLGADADLQIQHNGTNSIIRDNGTGALDLQVSNFAIVNLASDEFLAKGTQDGAFELYNDGTKRIETTSSGVTVTGVVAATSLDISGDADIDGTLEADAMTLNGTAITATATLSTGISNTNVAQFGSGVADNDFLRVDGTTIEGRSASEVLSDIGATTATAAANEATALAIALG